jgi:hypothetical protein
MVILVIGILSGVATAADILNPFDLKKDQVGMLDIHNGSPIQHGRLDARCERILSDSETIIELSVDDVVRSIPAVKGGRETVRVRQLGGKTRIVIRGIDTSLFAEGDVVTLRGLWKVVDRREFKRDDGFNEALYVLERPPEKEAKAKEKGK